MLSRESKFVMGILMGTILIVVGSLMLYVLFLSIVEEILVAKQVDNLRQIKRVEYVDNPSSEKSDSLWGFFTLAFFIMSFVIPTVGLLVFVRTIKNYINPKILPRFHGPYRSIWDDQPKKWEEARIAFQEYLADHHPEKLA